MRLIDLVVNKGRTVKYDGKLYREGQTLRAVPGKARLYVSLGRCQIDAAANSSPPVQSLPKPTQRDLRETLAEDRKPAEPVAEPPVPRRRNYRRRDMTAEQG